METMAVYLNDCGCRLSVVFAWRPAEARLSGAWTWSPVRIEHERSFFCREHHNELSLAPLTAFDDINGTDPDHREGIPRKSRSERKSVQNGSKNVQETPF